MNHSNNSAALDSPLLPAPGSPAWWTGRAPENCPGFDKTTGALHALPQVRLDTANAAEVLAYFDNGWTLTETLFSALNSTEAFSRAPYHNLRHPMIFYYAHPAVLYVNKLRVADLLQESLDHYFEQIFETGVDEMSWDDISKNEMQWPTIQQVHDYRKQVYLIVKNLIENHPGLKAGHAPITQSDPLWGLFLAFEHERIHLETSSVLMREMPLQFVKRPAAWAPDAPATGSKPGRAWRKIPAGRAKLGKPLKEPTFGWDNEYGLRELDVPEFEVTETLIGNGEFLEFVKANGYTERHFWSDEGWHWRNGVNARWPSFWISRGPSGLHQFEIRAVFEAVPFAPEWPAVVNYHEAKAYAAWKSAHDQATIPYRLLTEAEHQRLRSGTVSEQPNWGLRFGSESPVGGIKPTYDAQPGVFGNVWQWCEDHFNPLPGFKAHPHYEDFSTPCFDGKHQMILGGSFVSAGEEATPFARFHFRAHFFQQSGFRLVRPTRAKDTATRLSLKAHESSYENETVLGNYCLLHFGSGEQTVSYPFAPKEALEFPRRCADLVTEWAKKLGIEKGRAIDVGCAVGGSTFRLAETFQEAIGIDLSAAFITAAKTLKDKGELAYARRDEGELSTRLTARITDEKARSRSQFRQGDACSLPAELMGFDAVLAANLICRLPTPRSFLGRLMGSRGLVKPGGLLVLTTPFTWMERFTPRESWLGGYDGKSSEKGLEAALGGEFELVHREDFPLLLREHARKFEYIVPLATVWRKKG
jgi:5-histidylcysteine sulfoxide synthase/putative 4-mercaptohistidine N1-methyltranferase